MIVLEPVAHVRSPRTDLDDDRWGEVVATVDRRHPRGNTAWPLGTPVVDIKPVMAEFLPRGAVRQPAWSRDVMSAYWHPRDK